MSLPILAKRSSINSSNRKLWAPYALEEKDAEIARAEGLWKTQFLEACKRMAKPSQPVNE